MNRPDEDTLIKSQGPVMDEELFWYLTQDVFKADYSGYKPNVVESPNGDGNWDEKKQYAHIAYKYIDGNNKYKHLLPVLVDATQLAIGVAIELGVPPQFFPRVEYSAIRILKYPPGSESAPHTDFNLFSLMLYRNIEETFWREANAHLFDVDEKYPMIHFGEMLEMLCPCYKATKHGVSALPKEDGRWQYSAVFFAIPDHKLVLPDGRTVASYLEERLFRSRKEAY